MKATWRGKISKSVQRIFWIYFTQNFLVTEKSELNLVIPKIPCDLVPITSENCIRVREFREEGRISEYRKKLDRAEIGSFAECQGGMVGSIWATLNLDQRPKIARGYMALMPREALIHDIVTSEKSRGLGIGPFMVGGFVQVLLNEYRPSRIIIDVNVRNTSSLRMMQKVGLSPQERVFSVSACNHLLFHKAVKCK